MLRCWVEFVDVGDIVIEWVYLWVVFCLFISVFWRVIFLFVLVLWGSFIFKSKGIFVYKLGILEG